MRKPIEFNPHEAFKAANDIAREQEIQAQTLLWERIDNKAKSDERFRQLLVQNPKHTIAKEAEALKNERGEKIKVDPGVVESVTEKARAKYSSIVPEVAAQKVEDLIFGTLKDVRRSFNITLLLSQVLFYSGLLMMIAAFVVALASGEEFISLIFGAGGLGGVLISSLITSPLNRVQNAAGDLIQLQMAYLAYYKQLYLLGGEINSLSHGEAISYAREIDRAAKSIMSSIQKYVEKEEKSKSPASGSVKPSESGETI